MITYDQHLVKWVVGVRDPAKSHVSTLSRLGFDTIVLPRSVYLEGTLPETLTELPDISDKSLLYRLRERDCLAALGVE